MSEVTKTVKLTNGRRIEVEVNSEGVLTTYTNLLTYKVYRNYSGPKVRAILSKLGSLAKLPRKGHGVVVIDSPKVRTYLVADGDKKVYYFIDFPKPQRHNFTPPLPEIEVPKRVDMVGLMEKWGVERRRF